MNVNTKIHPTAIVSPKAVIGLNVEIGAFSIIYDNVVIGDNSVIGAFCEIGILSALSDGSPLVIGQGSLIRSHSIFYQASSFGENLTTGHRVTVREGTKAGKNLQIGTLSDLQGDCLIGDYVRLHSNVHIGKKSTIESFVWLFPYVVLTNDPTPPSETLQGCTIQQYAIVATSAVILPGVTVGQHALVAALACVGKDVPERSIFGGVPAKLITATSNIKLRDGSNRNAYPWTTHFHRGYPSEVVNQWLRESQPELDQ